MKPAQAPPARPEQARPEQARPNGEELTAEIVRAWTMLAMRRYLARRPELDALNVYPIADRDTGSNLVHTFAGAAQAVNDAGNASVAELLTALARGAVRAAHGNSGVLLAQALAGFAAGIEPDAVGIGPLSFARALGLGASAAHNAVTDPVEGTILSVLRAAADAALRACGQEAGLTAVVADMVRAAEVALQRTTSQIPVLSRARVVDAGGAGALILLEALLAVLSSDDSAEGPASWPSLTAAGDDAGPTTTPQYEVQYLISTGVLRMAELRSALVQLGDSVTIAAAGCGLYAVHAHVADPGAAIEACLDFGRPSRIRITELTLLPQAPTMPAAIFAVTSGSGTAELLRAEGVAVTESEHPTIELLLAGIAACRAERVVLLPDSMASRPSSEAAAVRARQLGIGVSVIPTISAVQVLAAVAVHDPGRRFDDDVIAMAEAAAATRVALVDVAAEESITYAGRCAAGDVLGLIDGEVVEIGSDYGRVATALLRRLIAAGGELVTVLVGAEVGAIEAANTVAELVRSRHRLVEVTVLYGGQRDCPLVIGVE